MYPELDDEPYPDPDAEPLIHHADLRAAIAATTGIDGDDLSEPSYEEGRRLALLRRLRDDPDSLMRRPLYGDDAMLRRLSDVRRDCPNFFEVTDMVARAVRASIVSRAPLRVKPFLCLGDPGLGKTYFVKALADAIGTTTAFVPGSSIATVEVLTGAAPVWRAAKIGALGAALLACPSLSPIVVIDEIDKIRVGTIDPQPHDGLLPLFEEETSARLPEGYLGCPIKADRVIFCLTANALEPLEGPLLDRLLVFRIAPLDHAGMRHVLRRMFDQMNEDRLNNALDAVDDDVIGRLRGFNARRAKAMLQLAADFTLADGRGDMTVADVDAAVRIVMAERQPRRAAGFLSRGC